MEGHSRIAWVANPCGVRSGVEPMDRAWENLQVRLGGSGGEGEVAHWAVDKPILVKCRVVLRR